MTDGSDFIDGGSSSESNGDTIDYSKILRITDGTTGGITVDLKDQDGTSTATVVVNSGNNDTIDNIENVFGTQNNDTITAKNPGCSGIPVKNEDPEGRI